ncbi:MAG: putative addiction module antidote protein [Candidatus Electrothrix sp. AR5]|nr:putative addiction module antidote protein [Candidatus Electrothrix sp. AR5]
MSNTMDFEEFHIERLRNVERARMYVEIAIENYEGDGDTEAFLLALRDVAKAQGGMGKLAEKTGLNRQNLYKALSAKGNPKFLTIEQILSGLGFRLSVQIKSDRKEAS